MPIVYKPEYTMAALLKLDNVSKTFGDREVLHGVSLEVAPKEVVFLVGPSGSGKSTLLRFCNLLEHPSSGAVLFEGADILKQKNVNALRQSVGMVFQSFNLYPHMTALWNVAIALRLVQRKSAREAREIAHHFLAEVGLAHRGSAYPAELSGGQQQRVAIARALALKPKLMLFDEPTSALDPELVGSVLDVIRKMRHEGMTMLIVSHEMQFAREAADKVVFLDQGRVVEAGAPAALFGNPQQQRTIEFLSRFSLAGSHG
ncbi:MAG: amino acid transporter ATP-binding protein [Hyphomicrobiales bacterium]|nr:amino acid transporter ATP-binding protein [Hyphomicrobiales bacterium]